MCVCMNECMCILYAYHGEGYMYSVQQLMAACRSKASPVKGDLMMSAERAWETSSNRVSASMGVCIRGTLVSFWGFRIKFQSTTAFIHFYTVLRLRGLGLVGLSTHTRQAKLHWLHFGFAHACARQSRLTTKRHRHT